MSDTEKQTAEASAVPAAGGFTPQPPPPQVDPAAVNDIYKDQAIADDALGVRAPDDTAKKALEAVQALVENNRTASQQLESLMAIVLDAAEVANRSASAVSTTGGQLNKAAEKLIDGAGKADFQAKIVLALAAAVLVGTAGTFSFMTVQLNSKVEQVDAMLLAVGKRAVDLKTRLESLDKMNATLDDINLKQDNSNSVQQAIEDKLTAAVEAAKVTPKPAPASASLTAPAPAKTAAPRPEGKSLNQQFAALDALLKEQSQAVKNLSSQVNNVQASVANVDSLKRDMETMANLQRQRAQETAQATLAANAKREKEQKDKERELIRERDQAKEREMMREREHTKEREQPKEREAAREREREKNRAVQYSREQSSPNGSTAANGMPSYTRQGGTDAEK